jgi:hypothetical protein
MFCSKRAKKTPSVVLIFVHGGIGIVATKKPII